MVSKNQTFTCLNYEAYHSNNNLIAQQFAFKKLAKPRNSTHYKQFFFQVNVSRNYKLHLIFRPFYQAKAIKVFKHFFS